jgi:metallo-beta-lactamase family protein
MSGRAPTLAFIGGAGTVTGSKYLVETATARVLVDCGLFQGLRQLREQNWGVAIHDPASLDAVVLTHAHVDHCGYLPRLVKAGFTGPVHATAGTVDLARIVLPDCGHLQEEEAEYANRKGFSRHHPAEPLYTEDEAWAAAALLEPTPFHEARAIADDVTIRLSPAGHILGSASINVQIGNAGAGVTFSGDLGRPWHPILAPPDPPGACDWLLVESTYGDRQHDDADAVARLAGVISRTVERGGSVLIPAFAVDRTEVMLYHLAELARRRALPPDLPIYVDSPMALDALHAYRRAFARRDIDIQRGAIHGPDPFAVPGLHEVRDVEQSKALNRPTRPSVIISASGMLAGGRVVHHLAHLLPDARNTILLVGYQAAGSRGRWLLDGVSELKMLGRYIRVRADVVDLPAFSVHADADELLQWVRTCPSAPSAVYVVHGEPVAARALATSVRATLDWSAVTPRPGERVRLDVA